MTWTGTVGAQSNSFLATRRSHFHHSKGGDLFRICGKLLDTCQRHVVVLGRDVGSAYGGGD